MPIGDATPVTGIDVLADLALVTATVTRSATQTAERLDAAPFDAARVDVRAGSPPPGYGIPDEATCAAMRTGLRTEGLVLDPVHEGEVMAGVLGLVGHGAFGPYDDVLFVHLGGLPAIHAHGDWITKHTGD